MLLLSCDLGGKGGGELRDLFVCWVLTYVEINCWTSQTHCSTATRPIYINYLLFPAFEKGPPDTTPLFLSNTTPMHRAPFRRVKKKTALRWLARSRLMLLSPLGGWVGGGRPLFSRKTPASFPSSPAAQRATEKKREGRDALRRGGGGGRGGAPNDVAERRREKNGAREGEVFLGTRREKKRGGEEEKARAESGEGE